MRRARLLFSLACLLAPPAIASELGDAFQAAFRQPAPVARHVERPLRDVVAGDIVGHAPQDMDLGDAGKQLLLSRRPQLPEEPSGAPAWP